MYGCDLTWGDEVFDGPYLGVGHVQQDIDGVLLLANVDRVAADLSSHIHQYIHTYIHTYIDTYIHTYTGHTGSVLLRVSSSQV